MCGSSEMHVVGFTAGGTATMELGSVPGGDSALAVTRTGIKQVILFSEYLIWRTIAVSGARFVARLRVFYIFRADAGHRRTILRFRLRGALSFLFRLSRTGRQD